MRRLACKQLLPLCLTSVMVATFSTAAPSHATDYSGDVRVKLSVQASGRIGRSTTGTVLLPNASSITSLTGIFSFSCNASGLSCSDPVASQTTANNISQLNAFYRAYLDTGVASLPQSRSILPIVTKGSWNASALTYGFVNQGQRNFRDDPSLALRTDAFLYSSASRNSTVTSTEQSVFNSAGASWEANIGSLGEIEAIRFGSNGFTIFSPQGDSIGTADYLTSGLTRTSPGVVSSASQSASYNVLSIDIEYLAETGRRTFKDIADNSVAAIASAGTLSARFLPAVGTSVNEAAALATEYTGRIVDHFNWVQEITKICVPSLGCDTPSSSNRAVRFIATRGTGLDPYLGGNPANRFKVMGGPTSDFLPFYYDETRPNVPGYDIQNLISTNTYDSQVDFSDAPNQIVNGTTIEFTTYLVGVGSDKSAIYLNGVDGIGFKWRYTEASQPTSGCIESPLTCREINFAGEGAASGISELVGILDATDYASAVPRLQGYASEASAVPEPATWATTFAGFALLGGAMRRRRRQVGRLGLAVA